MADDGLDTVHFPLEAALDALDELVYLVGTDGRLHRWNDRVEAVTGRDADQLAGVDLDELFVDDDRDRVRAAVEEVLTDGRTVVEADLLTADGEPVPYELTGTPLRDDDGEPVGVAGVGRDVAERRRADREREATIAALRKLYDMTTDADLGSDEKIERMLAVGCGHLGLENGFVTRIEQRSEEHPDGLQTVTSAHAEHPMLQAGASCPLSEAYCRKTIEERDLLAVADAVDEGWEDDPAYEQFGLGSYIGAKVIVDGALHGTLCFASTDPHDAFTEADRTLVRLMARLVSYEIERRQATERLRERTERLDRFASIVSHDLRNPLNVAQGRLDMVLDEVDDENLETVANAHERMRTLIDDLLTWARMEESDLESVDVDLGATLESCWTTVDTADATLVVETEAVISADESRLQQLLENLLRNAVEHAGPTVTVTVGDLPEGFYVADDGPGIPPDERDAVFESGHSSDPEGTGLGLSIAEQICEAHGWSIAAVESDAGGARLEITGVEVVDGGAAD